MTTLEEMRQWLRGKEVEGLPDRKKEYVVEGKRKIKLVAPFMKFQWLKTCVAEKLEGELKIGMKFRFHTPFTGIVARLYETNLGIGEFINLSVIKREPGLWIGSLTSQIESAMRIEVQVFNNFSFDLIEYNAFIDGKNLDM